MDQRPLGVLQLSEIKKRREQRLQLGACFLSALIGAAAAVLMLWALG